MWKPAEHDGWSTFGQLVPLIVLFFILGSIGFVGYQIYLGLGKIRAQATKNIGSKNITFTKEGMRVGVKHIDSEKYVDATQRVFVGVWNNSQPTASEERKRNVSSRN